MATSTFNAITYANKLKEAGMATRIADVQAEEMSNFVSNTLATKEDLKLMEVATKKELNILKLELQGFIVKALITAFAMIGTLQGLINYFVR